MPKTKKKLTSTQNLHKLPPAKQLSALATNDEIITKELAALIKELKIANSFKQKFFSSLLGGFATVIGATLVVAIVIYLLTQLANIEVLRPFIENIVSMVKNSYK
ncbi:hypothetical protein IT412_03780 [Candidatus Peregrinibacteria bacterium]|nr:hypothetical protein [Candidatus Peregrinibacteria bacterium]